MRTTLPWLNDATFQMNFVTANCGPFWWASFGGGGLDFPPPSDQGEQHKPPKSVNIVPMSRACWGRRLSSPTAWIRDGKTLPSYMKVINR